MNWEAINATAQLISSVGVVASLWYLAIQVHRSTRVAKLAAQDAATTAVRDVTKQFSENAELPQINKVTENRAKSQPRRKEPTAYKVDDKTAKDAALAFEGAEAA